MEKFYVETNGIGEYYGILCIDGLTVYEQLLLSRSSFKREIAGKKYVRVGEKDESGTLTQKEEFAVYFEQHGDSILTEAAYRKLVEDNAEEEL